MLDKHNQLVLVSQGASSFLLSSVRLKKVKLIDNTWTATVDDGIMSGRPIPRSLVGLRVQADSFSMNYWSAKV